MLDLDKFGYNTNTILKAEKINETQALIIVRHVELSYFSPSGKARLGTRTTYCVELYDITTDDYYDRIDGVYWLSSKKSATQEFNVRKKTA